MIPVQAFNPNDRALLLGCDRTRHQLAFRRHRTRVSIIFPI
ncbi:hypothetical protein OSCI_3800061 [Kamptonema sp. PCC 6506]|nr:hypothetical protein OSCI_3800061 [Kamptonema sp. PCC 6506]